MNEEPKEDVARREQSQELEGKMDGWMDGCTTAAKGEKKLVLPSSEREMGSYGTLLQRSKRHFWHRRHFWNAGCAARSLGLPLLLLPLALFLLGLHRRVDLQLLRDKVGHIRSRGAGMGGGGHQCRYRTRT